MLCKLKAFLPPVLILVKILVSSHSASVLSSYPAVIACCRSVKTGRRVLEDSLSSLHIMSLQGMSDISNDDQNDDDDGGDQSRRATTPSSTGQMELDPLRAEPSLPIPLILCCSVTQLQPTNQPTKHPTTTSLTKA